LHSSSSSATKGRGSTSTLLGLSGFCT